MFTDDHPQLASVAQALAHFYRYHDEKLLQDIAQALKDAEIAAIVLPQVHAVAYEWCGYPGYTGRDLVLVNTLRDFGLDDKLVLRRAILEYLFVFEPEKTLLLTHRLRAIDHLIEAKASVRALMNFHFLGRGVAKNLIESALSILQDVDDLLNNP